MDTSSRLPDKNPKSPTRRISTTRLTKTSGTSQQDSQIKNTTGRYQQQKPSSGNSTQLYMIIGGVALLLIVIAFFAFGNNEQAKKKDPVKKVVKEEKPDIDSIRIIHNKAHEIFMKAKDLPMCEERDKLLKQAKDLYQEALRKYDAVLSKFPGDEYNFVSELHQECGMGYKQCSSMMSIGK